MIAALNDFDKFTSMAGRYTPFLSSRMESLCYYESMPDDEINKLHQGDVLLVGNYNNFLSWLVMYLTDSTFSHLMIYDCDGYVSHMTLEGYKYQKLYEVFGKRKRFLAIRHPKWVDFNEKVSQQLRSGPQRTRYGYRRPFFVGISYFLCLNPFGFQRRQYFDIGYLFLSVGVGLGILTGSGAALVIALGYLSIIFVYQCVCRKIFGYPLYPGTPEQLWRLCQLGEFVPMLNIRGFQRYMMSIAHVLGRDGELAEGKSYPIPEGLGGGFAFLTSVPDGINTNKAHRED
jgi:hypothetical protein